MRQITHFDDTIKGVIEFCESEGQPSESIKKTILELFSIIDDINACHGCLNNLSDDLSEIKAMTEIANFIDMPKPRWWEK